MGMKESRIKKTGNSLSLALSKAFLDSIGLKEGDTVWVDETKLAEAILKVNDRSHLDRRVDEIIQQSSAENAAVYRDLVDR